MIGGILVGSVGVEPIRALYYAAILNGLSAPPLIALLLLLLILARDPSLCGRDASGSMSAVIAASAVAVGVLLPVFPVFSS